MRNFSKKTNKKLSLMVGLALSFGVAYGVAPSDAMAMSVTRVDNTYTIDGTQYTDVKQAKNMIFAELAKDNATVEVDQNTASALKTGSDGFTLGKGTTFKVKGEGASQVEVKGGDAASQLKVDGTTVSGDNVNLSSVNIAASGKDATVNISGKVDSITTSGGSAVDFGSSDKGGTLTVGNLDVKDGMQVTVKADVKAETVTVAGNSAQIATEGKATIKADSMVIGDGAQIASGTKVDTANITITVNDEKNAAALADQIKQNLKVSNTEGGALNLEVKKADGTAVSDDVKNTISSAVDSAAKDSGVTVSSKVSVVTNGDKYSVGGKEVTGDELAQAVSDAFKSGTDTVVLDKGAAQKLKSGVTVPAGKTLSVATENDGNFTAKAKSDVNLTVDGTTIKSDTKNPEFESISIDSKDKTVYNDIEGAKVDTVTVKGNGDFVTKDVTVGDLNVESGKVSAAAGGAEIKATNVKMTGGELAVTKVNADTVSVGAGAKTSAAIDAKDVTVAGTTTGDITADNVTVSKGASLGTAQITASNIKVDDIANLAGASIAAKDGKLTIEKTSGTLTAAEKAQLEKQLPEGTKVTVKDGNGTQEIIGTGGVTPTPGTAEEAKKAADEAVEKADAAVEKTLGKDASKLLSADLKKMATEDPFTAKEALPDASAISKLANVSADDVKALAETKTQLRNAKAALVAASVADTDESYQAVEKALANFDSLGDTLDQKSFQKLAAEATAAVQQAGRTAAAPGATSSRTASVITSVMTDNVATRTTELRGIAAAVDEGRPAPDNVWFQYKHTNMDVDNGDTYSKSTVNTNNFQLGYDAKVGPNDYLGAYIGTVTGNADFRGPAADGRIDIENSFDFGVYGTHMLPADQYIDYMVHTGKFDSKYAGEKWGTTDTGLMVGYGAKIAENDRLTWNPYVQLAYDKVDVDSYMAGLNRISSDSSDNWTAKLGINLMDASGFYGGMAYSRGLSGSYNAYINGVPMPTQDNNANVLYLSLGYRANMTRNVFLDLSMEKTFADYKGWSAAGKINFYF